MLEIERELSWRDHLQAAGEDVMRAAAETDTRGSYAVIRANLFHARGAITRALAIMPNDDGEAA